MAGKKGRSGRPKGTTGIKKLRSYDTKGNKLTHGTKVNQYGVKFTKKEQQQFKNMIQKANYQRQKRIKELPPVAQNQYKTFNKETDFFYRKKGMSTMQQFKSKKEFNNYMRSLRNMSTGRWMDKKAKVYQESYKTKIMRTFAIDNPNYGKKYQREFYHTQESKELTNLLNKYDAQTFSKLIENEQIDALGEWYKGEDPYARYQKVKQQLITNLPKASR